VDPDKRKRVHQTAPYLQALLSVLSPRTCWSDRKFDHVYRIPALSTRNTNCTAAANAVQRQNEFLYHRGLPFEVCFTSHRIAVSNRAGSQRAAQAGSQAYCLQRHEATRWDTTATRATPGCSLPAPSRRITCVADTSRFKVSPLHRHTVHGQPRRLVGLRGGCAPRW
jgi:hypothetical protein